MLTSNFYLNSAFYEFLQLKENFILKGQRLPLYEVATNALDQKQMGASNKKLSIKTIKNKTDKIKKLIKLLPYY